SSVVNELHHAIVQHRGIFVSGKFDQYKRAIPYATLAQALQTLVRQILTKSETEVEGWRQAIRDALGLNGQLMVNLIPELELIIGKQPPVPELPPLDSENRFQAVLRAFLGVFARNEHPLALFLDDLQWLDAATLSFLENVISHPEVRHLLLIGAYRDNEVSPSHPLMLTLDAVRNTAAPVREIVLAPLSFEDVNELISDSVRQDPARTKPLARLVHEKTGANPFFVIQFLTALAEERLLEFDRREAAWRWDVNCIRVKRITENVVDLLVGKLNRLPDTAREVLKKLAGLGNTAKAADLAILHGGLDEVLQSDLREAVRGGFVVRSADSYNFVHDRVQEAAYSLIPQEERAAAHLRIARLMLSNADSGELDEKIFEIVNQFNRGAELLASVEERERVAELNLLAGRRAQAASAHASALTYLSVGGALLANESWEREYELTFALERRRAESEFLTGHLEAAEERLSMLSRRARSTVDDAAVTCLRLDLYTTLDRSDRAVDVCLQYLQRLGVTWSSHPTAEEVFQEYEHMWGRIGNRPIEALVDLPPMTDPDWCATMDVLTKVMPPAMFTDKNLQCLILGRMANLSLEHGNCDGSCLGYVWLGGVLGTIFGDYRTGFRFGKLGVDLMENRGLNRFKARVYLGFGSLVNPWTQPMRSGLAFMRRALVAAQEAGDLTYAAYACYDLIAQLLPSGDRLVEVQWETENALALAKKARFGLMVDGITGQLRLIRTLRGLTPKFGSFDDDQFDEVEFERHLDSNPHLANPACRYWIRKLQARFYAGDDASALAAAEKAERLLWAMPPSVEVPDYHFHGALARAKLCHVASAGERTQYLRTLVAHHKQLENWAKSCAANFENRAALVGAEIARIEGRTVDAEHLYEQAIRSAHANGFVHNEALANELAARFYLARGFEKIAYAYLQDARYCYLRWGATAKVRQLDELYPQLRGKEPVPGPTSTIDAAVEHLDLANVIKVSQAVSSEIVLEKLIDSLMRTAIEHAGAERGLLILPRGVVQRIKAEATTNGDTIRVRLLEAPLAEGLVPESIVNYVVRTQESLILDDALANNAFSTDMYIRRHHARSILCLALINQAKLIGVLYLENNLTPHVFTPTRIAVLKLLASQAAISLENSRLYRDLEEREAKIRRLVDANVIGIYVGNVEGEIIEANEAFLHMVGYNREDLVSGRVRWTDLTPAEWRDRDEQALGELRAPGTVQPYEKEYFRKDGSRVPALVGAAIFEGSGNEGVAFVLDLREQKRAEEALRRSEAYLSEAQILSRTGSFGWNVTTGKIYWSQETFRIFEYDSTTEPTLELVLDRIHPEDRALVQQVINRVSEERKDFDSEHRLLMPDDSVKYLRIVGHPSKTEAGSFEFVGAVTDITERKLAEAKARKQHEELAHLSRVAIMGEMAGALAHELNQPITGIVNNASAGRRFIAKGRANPPKLDGLFEAVVEDGRRAGEIIRGIRGMVQ
ncbi:MAG: AAA family ATPase, partial [Acidobacteriaceae bacterium]|nr:AAA family ATPase [Acidobacteriaceae bacterium]